MEAMMKKLKDFTNKKYCMLTLAISTVFSTLIALTEVIMKLFKFDPSGIKILDTPATLDDVLKNARLLLIYFAANALVGLLIELRSRLKIVENETPKSFINLIEATDSIKNIIKKAAFKNRTDALEIKVYGRRHRQNMDIIKEALNDIRGETTPHRNIIIYLYFSNPDFCESLKSFHEDYSFTKMISEQKIKTEDSINNSRNELDAVRFNFVELKIRKHFDTPQFWVIQIDNKDIFWGYFKRVVNGDTEAIRGTLNKCFHFDNGVSELDGFSEWINNIFERLEKWSKKIN